MQILNQHIHLLALPQIPAIYIQKHQTDIDDQSRRPEIGNVGYAPAEYGLDGAGRVVFWEGAAVVGGVGEVWGMGGGAAVAEGDAQGGAVVEGG